MSERSYDKLAVIADQRVKEREFWLTELSGILVKTPFPYDRKTAAVEDRGMGMEVVKLDFTGEIFSMLMKLSKESDRKLHMILAAALAALLAKYAGSSDIIFGTPIYKQEIDTEFVNTILVLRNRVEEDMTFKDLLLQVRENIVEATEHQNYPIEILLSQLGIPYHGDKTGFPLFDVMLLCENIHDKTYTGDIRYNMLFSFNRSGEHMEGVLEYNSRLYEQRTAEQIFSHYQRLLREVLINADIVAVDADILGENEKQRILYDFNGAEVDYPQNKTIHELFAERAEKSSDSIALVSRELLHDWQLTFGELNKKSDQLARFLKNKGVRVGSIVGLMVEKSLEMLVGIWGILKAGGAYLPIDLEYPRARIEYMLKESGTTFLLTYGRDTAAETVTEKREKGPAVELEIIDIFSSRIYKNSLPGVTDINSLNDAAYIIYTSGSSGKPKGVVVEHRNVIAYLNAFYREFEITAADTALQQASCSFDAFVEEVYPTMLRGGKIALCPKYVIMDSAELSAFILNHQITFISVSPLLLNEIDRLPHSHIIRIFISGGDVLKKEYVTNLLKLKGSSVYNTYGPTETTVCATYHKCSPADNSDLPIGKSISGYRIYILDQRGRLLPVGVPGELCIAGAGVTRGYLNNPQLTAEKFVNYNLSSNDVSSVAKKIYRTGDLCRWLPDGSVAFLGRIDDQVKIRGFRVELGEIESQLLQHEAVEAALVLLKETSKENPVQYEAQRYLCAYTASEKELSVHELREYLSNRLPGYMVPSHFVILEKMPLTPNGKPDMKALNSYEPVSGAGVEYIPPGTDTEKIVADIWKELLQVDKVSIHDNFFDIGGNSMLLLKAANKIRETLKQNIPYVVMFQYTTIHSLAGYLNPETGTVDSGKYEEQAETLDRGKSRMKRFIKRAKEIENG